MIRAAAIRAGLSVTLLALAGVLSGCGEPSNERRIERLEDNVEDLEERVEALEEQRR